MYTTNGFGLVFRTGIMLSIARTVRICASSKTATSTLCRPRPKPFSRAPNMMRLPDVNVISCWPFALRMRSTYLPSIGLCSISHMSANVSSLVRVWWAVQMAFRFGVSIALRNNAVPTVKVLPICLQLDSTAPSAPHAYLPSVFLANRSHKKPCCHKSKRMPALRAALLIRVNSLPTMPSGWRRTLAISDNRRSDIVRHLVFLIVQQVGQTSALE